MAGGIRQGCTASPQLFVMVVNMVIHSIVESGLGYSRDEKFYVPVLFYADVGLLLAGSLGLVGRRRPRVGVD